MDEQSILSATEKRTRRNIMKMGAILGSAGAAAVLTKVNPSRAPVWLFVCICVQVLAARDKHSDSRG